MKEMRFAVSGRVARVGYRDRVAEIARKLGVKGKVQNMEDEISVEIFARAPPEQLVDFAKKINIYDPPIEVEKIESEECAQKEEFTHFKIVRGDGFAELGERMDVAGNLLYGIDKKQDKMLEKQDKTIETIEKTLGKQDKTIEAIDNMSAQTTSRFDTVDAKYGKISDKLDKISVSIDKLVDVLQHFGRQ